MENLNRISDNDLLSLVKSKAQTERQLTLEVIELLREIQKRNLHLKRGYSSLHEYCVQELKYSDGAAFRRIKAMRLVETLPEAAQCIASGELNLTTASQLQSAFEGKAKERTPLSREEKTELLGQVQNLSTREVEKTLAVVCPELARVPERARPINESEVRLELVLDQELFAKLEKLKQLTSHTNKNLRELLEWLVDRELTRREAAEAKVRAATSPPKPQRSRYIPSVVRHHVWFRDGGCCTYRDAVTGKRCESRHRLQYEHCEPFAMGGETRDSNLRLLCSHHNRLMAVQVYGSRKVEQHERCPNFGP